MQKPTADRAVFDASAVLVMLGNEPGADAVQHYVGSAVMSAVNFAEVVSKLVERGATALQVQAMLAGPAPQIVEFDEGQAVQAGFLRAPTRPYGLSLADRACLGLALQLGVPVLTTDRIWNDLDVEVEVVLIR